jgi:hypothetical protein
MRLIILICSLFATACSFGQTIVTEAELAYRIIDSIFEADKPTKTTTKKCPFNFRNAISAASAH